MLITNDCSHHRHALSSRRTALGRPAIVLGIVAVVLAATIGILVSTNQANPGGLHQSSSQSTLSTPPTTTTSTTTTSTNRNTISLTSFYLEANGTSPGYPGPFLSGEIFVNASVNWSSYALYTNNTYCGTRDFNSTGNPTIFTYEFKGAPCIPLTVGNTYLIKFVVIFTDGTNATATTSVVAE